MSLVPVAHVAPMVGRKDRRAVMAALADLGVPVVRIRSRYYVREGDVTDALDKRARTPAGRQPATVNLRPGERLWS